jgi:hypothetical protein
MVEKKHGKNFASLLLGIDIDFYSGTYQMIYLD